MKIRIGECEIKGKMTPVYVCGSAIYRDDDGIVLGIHDMDKRWVEELLSLSPESEEFRRSSFFAVVYLVYSIRKRLYIKDIEALEKHGLPEGIDFDIRKGINKFIISCLITFMKEKGYSFCILKGHQGLFEMVPALMEKGVYVSGDHLSSAGFKLFAYYARQRIIRSAVYSYIRVLKYMNKPFITSSISRHYKKVVPVKTNAARSESLFFKAFTQDGRKMFIKAAATGLVNTMNEKLAGERINELTAKRYLYLLPLKDDDMKAMNVFPYLQHITLGDLLSKRNLTETELKSLAGFLVEVSDDLYKCKVVHCDIHPDNILIAADPDGSKVFKLADFGCASLSGTKRAKGYLSKAEIRYCGRECRYSGEIWDDAASAAFILERLIPDEGDDYVTSCIIKLKSRQGRLVCRAV